VVEKDHREILYAERAEPGTHFPETAVNAV
jgi:hypothetical protein